ncbi:hypothetical protein M758_1G302100 [Ceratodon purpureus]|nr:hypothetical protein M758_1G302100 [Ceratodon purpureus]
MRHYSRRGWVPQVEVYRCSTAEISIAQCYNPTSHKPHRALGVHFTTRNKCCC